MSEPFAVNTLQRAGSKLSSQDWSIDEVTLEGWCQKEKGTDEFLLDTSAVSQLSENYWGDETKPSVFKNALANLSEGLASMHRKDILNSVSSNRKSTANKNKNFNIKSNSNIGKIKANSQRSTKSQKENPEKENLFSIIQQSEPNLLNKKAESITQSNRASAFLQEFDLNIASQNQDSLEDETKTLPDSNLNTSTNVKHETKDITDQSEDLKDANNTENALRSVKASIYGSEIGSSSQLEIDFDSEKASTSTNKKYSVMIKKSKLPMSQRSVRQMQKDDLRVNSSGTQTKQILSSQDALIALDTNKPLKRDSIPVMPIPQNKTVVSIKEMQFNNLPLKIDGLGHVQNITKTKDENHQGQCFQKRPSEVIEFRTTGTSLRNVLGQAFKNAEAPPLFSLNLKGTAIGKQKESSKENIKESVEYILGLYKSGADKNLEKSKTQENNYTRESFKVMENLKRTSYHPKVQPLKEKVMNQDDVFNRVGLRSQGRPETAFRIKKANSDIEDKKGFLLGSIKMNEVVFQ